MSDEFINLVCKNKVETINGKTVECGGGLFEFKTNYKEVYRLVCAKCGYTTEFTPTGMRAVD